jgi:CBS domain-containing protein
MEATMLVKEVMRVGTEWVDPGATVRDVAVKMRDLGIGSLAVCNGAKPVGIVTDRDIALRCCADAKDPATTTAGEIMTQDLAWCYGDQKIEDAAHLMEERHIRRLPVLDREENMVGFLSVDDIAAKASFELGGEVLKEAAGF